MTATIEPIQTTAGIAYRVTRVFPNWASAQRAMADLSAINPAAFESVGLAAGKALDDFEGLPPNCVETYTHPGIGQFLANAVHDIAEQPDDACTAVGCALVPDEH